jgi:hypothetical protein
VCAYVVAQVLHDSRVTSSSVSTRSMRPGDAVVDDVGGAADAEFAALPRMMAFDLSGAPQHVRATFFRGHVGACLRLFVASLV